MNNESNFNIIVNLHPTYGTHLVLVIRRRGSKVYYFDSFGVETPPIFLEEYVDLGSNERIQEYDESYCGAYCLCMIYLIVRRFTIEGALNILVNQVICPKVYDKCFCFNCNVEVNVCVNDNQGTYFADDNVNDNVKDNFNDNVKDNVNDDVNHNVNDNVNDNQGTCFADDNVNDNVNDIFNDNVKDNVYDNVNDNVNYNVNDDVNNNVNDNRGICFADFNDYVNDNDDDDKYISIFSERTPS